MAKCQHCGEEVRPGQEVCFACGQKVRAGKRRHERPANAMVFVLAGVLVLAAVVGAIIVIANSGRRSRLEMEQKELARIQDSVRQANRAAQETARAAQQRDEMSDIVGELDKLEARFAEIQGDVVKGAPTPEQSKVISQIRAGLTRLRQLASRPPKEPEELRQLKEQIRDGEREIRTLTSQLARAPKAKQPQPQSGGLGG